MPRFIDPIARLGSRLLEVEKPARYTGGEYGIYAKRGILKAAIVFPDLYELGMSNQAFRIIYNGLNRMENISCDRAFAIAPDFEKLLAEEGVPLYGLDTGIALGDTDLLLFTLGYELGITGMLSVLESSRIALRASDRDSNDPIVIMGGPCVSNPLPYSLFVDAFWIGEAEAGFFDLVNELLAIKKSGADRSALLARIKAHPHAWTPGKSSVGRAIYSGFADEHRGAAVFPASSIKTVQHHGAVEIMRGCPNGCRFCHAGMWYRPMRQKNAALVMEETEAFIREGGYREISLSSLSTGDYCHIDSLIAALNARYAGEHISFQLPSLRVSGFSLPLLAKVSEVRKSGLTFAVETPAQGDQLAINKQVPLSEVISIMGEAKKYGWKGVKLYFMVGLPLGEEAAAQQGSGEEIRIVDFVMEAAKAAKSHFNLNLGVFVPKPHTPYQWAAQLDEETAWQKFNYIRDRLKPRGHKVSVHNPFMSLLEGIFSRGTMEAGLLAEEAFKRGCRLDAWSEHFQADVWREIIREKNNVVSGPQAAETECIENYTFINSILGSREKGKALPWSVIQSGVGEPYLQNEIKQSRCQKTTSPCAENCTHHCGICSAENRIVHNSIQGEVESGENSRKTSADYGEQYSGGGKVFCPDGAVYRVLFTFSKERSAVFIPHLGVIEVFSSAVLRSGLRASFTRGFNPLLKIDFASPASVGLCCMNEIASVDFEKAPDPGAFVEQLNKSLPFGFAVKKAEIFLMPGGVKKYSPAALLWGFVYGENNIAAADEKAYRLSVQTDSTIFGLVRNGMLAKNPQSGETEDYFELYRKLYPVKP